MLLAHPRFQQLRIIAFSPFVQLLTCGIEGQPLKTREPAGSDKAAIFPDALSHHLLQLLLVSQELLCVRIMIAAESVEPVVDGLVPQFSWVIFHAIEFYIAVFYCVRIGDLFCQRQFSSSFIVSFIPLFGRTYNRFFPSLPFTGVGCTSYHIPLFFLGISYLFQFYCKDTKNYSNIQIFWWFVFLFVLLQPNSNLT